MSPQINTILYDVFSCLFAVKFEDQILLQYQQINSNLTMIANLLNRKVMIDEKLLQLKQRKVELQQLEMNLVGFQVC